MIEFIKNFFRRSRYKLPVFLYGIWYNSRVHSTDTHLCPVVFDQNDRYIDCQSGNIHLMGRTDDGKYDIYYKVVSIERDRPWSDWLYPSDCIKCDMIFNRLEEVKP